MGESLFVGVVSPTALKPHLPEAVRQDEGAAKVIADTLTWFKCTLGLQDKPTRLDRAQWKVYTPPGNHPSYRNALQHYGQTVAQLIHNLWKVRVEVAPTKITVVGQDPLFVPARTLEQVQQVALRQLWESQKGELPVEVVNGEERKTLQVHKFLLVPRIGNLPAQLRINGIPAERVELYLQALYTNEVATDHLFWVLQVATHLEDQVQMEACLARICDGPLELMLDQLEMLVPHGQVEAVRFKVEERLATLSERGRPELPFQVRCYVVAHAFQFPDLTSALKKQVLDSEAPATSTEVLRLAHLCDDQEIYQKIRSWMRNLNIEEVNRLYPYGKRSAGVRKLILSWYVYHIEAEPVEPFKKVCKWALKDSKLAAAIKKGMLRDGGTRATTLRAKDAQDPARKAYEDLLWNS